MFTPGQYSLEQILEIRKAFEANTAANGVTPFVDPNNPGAALSMQSLDKTFVAIVSSNVHFKFLSQIPKRGVKQVLAEYNKQDSHGGGWYNSSFIGQSDEPDFRDASLQRLFDEVCYIGEGFDYNKVVDTVDNVQDPSIIQGNSALRRGMENLSRSVWFGSKAINKLTCDGFLTRVRDTNDEFVMDARGQLPDVDEMKYHTSDIASSFFGLPNKAWMHPQTKALFDQVYQGSREFVFQNAAQNPGNVGQGNVIKGLYDSSSKNEFLLYETDIFMDKHNWRVPMRKSESTGELIEGPTSLSESPNTPSLAVEPVVSDANSKFTTDAGVHRYRVASGGLRHWSAACESEQVTVPSGGGAELTITPANTGNPATRFAIFRSIKPGSTDIRYMREIVRTPGATTVFVDLNEDIPGTTIMVIGDFNAMSGVDETRTYVLSELLPFTKTLFPYGAGGRIRSKLGMVEWYGVPQIFAPEKFRVWKNIPVRT